MLLVLRRNGHAKQRRRHALEHRRGVRMRGRDGHAFARDAGLPLQPRCHLRDDIIRHAEVIDRDQNGRILVVSADGQRLGPDRLRDAFGFSPTKAKAAEPDRIGRRNIHGRRADLVNGVRRARWRRHLRRCGADESGPNEQQSPQSQTAR